MSGVVLFPSEKEGRLFAMGVFGVIAIDKHRVNIDDLLACGDHVGSIVRCDGNPAECLQVLPALGDSAPLGCVAGWISEDE